MRNDIIVAGIILVIVGIIFYFIGNNTLEESRWYFLSNYQSMRSSGNFMVMIGYIFGIVGFITSIAGIFAPTEEQMKKVIMTCCINDQTRVSHHSIS